ncbi:hypothetical protein AJ80_05777 [Polytolypa hystricis UAMH7299]|uniref:Uncharacterized protein n=1 Tax=Polytolypa hystricis (strain UAMH7299) TaxID=1447883 RepID=A0A2B7Y1D3_POLH7|nr:hypothetical protein AJ80_05777 [Polytolypa hystricis UAMH7299]
MSWLYPFASSASSSSSRHRRSKHHRSRSPSSRSRVSSAPSIFGHSQSNRSVASSIFSLGSSSSSSRRAKPRSGFVHRIVRKIRRLFRDIMRWARKHPMKVLFMVIMPLITGGVLGKLLKTIGVSVPRGLMGDGGGSRDGGFGGLGGIGGGGGGEGLASSVGSLVSVAKMFM